MKKTIIIVLGLLLAYNSVYIKKLSEIRNQQQKSFDFNTFADSLFYTGILKSNRAIELTSLLASIQSNSDSAFKSYGNRLGIGNSAYFQIKAQGKVIEKSTDGLKLVTDANRLLFVDTKYIFGNAIRDASGLVKLTDFKTNADFNKLSESLNTVIRERAIPEDVKKITIGDNILVVGAIKLRKGQKQPLQFTVLPTQLIKSE